MLKFVSLGFYFFGIFTLLIPALNYLFSKKIMNYHEDAIERKWTEIDNKFQLLILTWLKLLGSVWIIIIISIVFMIISFMNGNWIANFTLLVTGGLTSLANFIATTYIKEKTKGNPPNLIVGLGFISFLLGFFIGLLVK